MITRRVAAPLRQQDWFAVAIEFALVVAGVFLGIQVANWNDSRKERELEATYLARIMQDVRSDVAEMDEIIGAITLIHRRVASTGMQTSLWKSFSDVIQSGDMVLMGMGDEDMP